MSFETKLTPVRIGLTEMLEALWDEIQNASSRAQTRGEGRFVFEEAEIEVAVAVEAETATKFNLYVVELGGGLTGRRTATIRVKVKQYTEEMAKDNSGRFVFLLDKQAHSGESPAETKPSSMEEARRLKGAGGLSQ